MEKGKKKVLIVIGLFILFVILICIAYIVFNRATNNTSNNKDNENTYIDPGSGETVYNPTNKAPEKEISGTGIIYLGFSKLLDKGISDIQVKNIKNYINYYSITNNKDIKEVSITVKSINHDIDKDINNKTINITSFIITIDRKSTLDVKLKYKDLREITLELYNPYNNTQIFTSDNIDRS